MLTLLIASFLFIGFISFKVLAFAILYTIINYYLGIVLEKYGNRSIKKKIFWTGISINVGILAFFKYINFLFENFNFILSVFPDKPQIPYLSVLIPVGISLLYFPGYRIFNKDKQGK